MSLNNVRYIPVYIYNSGPLRKGHGAGGIFKGWLKRTIPIIKTKVVPTAKRVGKDIAVQLMDSVYTAGRDMLVGKKDQSENNVEQYAVKDDANFKFAKPVIKKKSRQPKKVIKRKNTSKSVSRIRNAKRKRPNGRFEDLAGFRKQTL